jgi:hypothetical protein
MCDMGGLTCRPGRVDDQIRVHNGLLPRFVVTVVWNVAVLQEILHRRERVEDCLGAAGEDILRLAESRI